MKKKNSKSKRKQTGTHTKKKSAASIHTHFHKKTQPSIQCSFVAATNVRKQKRRSRKRACASQLCVLLDSTFPLSLANLETVNWEYYTNATKKKHFIRVRHLRRKKTARKEKKKASRCTVTKPPIKKKRSSSLQQYASTQCLQKQLSAEHTQLISREQKKHEKETLSNTSRRKKKARKNSTAPNTQDGAKWPCTKEGRTSTHIKNETTNLALWYAEHHATPSSEHHPLV